MLNIGPYYETHVPHLQLVEAEGLPVRILRKRNKIVPG